MKNIAYIICLFVVMASITSCEKDIMKDVNNGDWNNERNIIEINLEQQIGLSEIIRTETEALVTLTINASSVDLASVSITDLVLSYEATSDVSIGETLNFDNAENTASLTVTSKKGETLDWTINIVPFVNEIEGSWSISSFYMKWDDGFGWGNSGEGDVSTLLDGTSAGLDDIITFGPVEGTNTDGLLYGVYERTTGADALSASFVYEPTGTDWGSKFDHVPTGSGLWVLNKNNSITITVNEQSYTTSIFNRIDDSTLMLPLDFGLQDLGLINWDDYYGDNTNKFCAMTELFYTLSK